ncbi:MAG: UDP-N-acetylglucosamine 4,6-dehydratase (inverting) [Elusimicrobia bacterium]|nr:UDP-N-acetylglucosamine 4,6-dehydratase (inverting) [Elusimicrobiota bacterium]
MAFSWKNQVILLTGGTGSFGQKFTEIVLKKYKPQTVRIFSRDEWKQWDMEKRFRDPRLRFFLGDVRDKDRLRRAMEGATLVVHAAALKQVPLCEYNPFEAIKTNVMGAQNVIDAALDAGIPRVMALSTDKAVNPVNLYGASKLCAEKLFVQGNAYTGPRSTRFSCVRYGNVVGSRGSVLPLFLAQRSTGRLTVTDERMTRFWLTLEQGVAFVVRCIEQMRGGEVFVPKIPSMRLIDMARAVAPQARIDVTGIRPGEKIHEVLITEDEAPRTYDGKDGYVVLPSYDPQERPTVKNIKFLSPQFRYSSETNTQWMTKNELLKIVEGLTHS